MEQEGKLERFNRNCLPRAIVVVEDMIAAKGHLYDTKVLASEKAYQSLIMGLDELESLKEKNAIVLPSTLSTNQVLVHNPYGEEHSATYITADRNAEFEINLCKLQCIKQLAAKLGARNFTMSQEGIVITSFCRRITDQSAIKVVKHSIKAGYNNNVDYSQKIQSCFTASASYRGLEIDGISESEYEAAEKYAKEKHLLLKGSDGIKGILDNRKPGCRNPLTSYCIQYSSDEDAKLNLDAALSLIYSGDFDCNIRNEIREELKFSSKIKFSFNVNF